MNPLIDGDNLRFTAGVLGRRLGPDRLWKVRHRRRKRARTSETSPDPKFPIGS